MNEKTEDDIHNVSSERLAQMIEEIAKKHAGVDNEALLEAARRIRIPFVAPISFNHEAFE